jgi:hypothetical protein
MSASLKEKVQRLKTHVNDYTASDIKELQRRLQSLESDVSLIHSDNQERDADLNEIKNIFNQLLSVFKDFAKRTDRKTDKTLEGVEEVKDLVEPLEKHAKKLADKPKIYEVIQKAQPSRLRQSIHHVPHLVRHSINGVSTVLKKITNRIKRR